MARSKKPAAPTQNAGSKKSSVTVRSQKKPMAQVDAGERSRPVAASPRPVLVQRTAQEVIVDTVQSFELVRCVILATISAVTWGRDMFNDKHFIGRMYDTTNPDPSYEAFVRGDHGFSQEKHNDKIFTWMILIPGPNPGANKLLRWLDDGVALALEKKYLSKIQLLVYEDSNADAKVLEAYVIDISYDNPEGVPAVQVSVRSGDDTGDEPQGRTLMMTEAKSNIKRLLNNIIVHAQALGNTLPEIPIQGAMTMKLEYNDSCPSDWVTPGFKASTSGDALSGMKFRSHTADTGRHHISVSFFNNHSHNHNHPNSTLPQTPLVCEQPPSSQSSTIGGDETQEIGLRTLAKIGVTRGLNGPTQDTQQLTSGSASTTPVALNRTYTQPILDRIAGARAEARHKDIDDADYPPKIKCECRVDTNSKEALLACAVCNGFVHRECYGFLSSDQTPEPFVCYTCLLLNEDHHLWQKKIRDCVKRRALQFLSAGGNPWELEAHLDCNHEFLSGFLDELQDEGCISWDKKGLKRWGKEKGLSGEEFPLRFINNGVYFQPNKDLEHLFGLPPLPESRKRKMLEDSSTLVVEEASQAALTPKVSQKKRNTKAERSKKVLHATHDDPESPWVFHRS
ncbi:HORMA domain-containing protein [Calycina marina]|uniref:HORMA domain-containing protein n=1 Tax=Calycina marina TaxID=1763456 RepID=A0A9P7Z5N5_9HELO|nr:HORMA domain-containing protein [Calycina marina]